MRPAMNHQVWRRRQRRRRKLNKWSLSARQKITLKVICHNWVKDLRHLQQHKHYHHHLHLEGGCFKPFQQLAQEHDFTENLIHTSALKP